MELKSCISSKPWDDANTAGQRADLENQPQVEAPPQPQSAPELRVGSTVFQDRPFILSFLAVLITDRLFI